MASFDLAGFSCDPSVECLRQCRKVDLYAIVAQFSVELPKALVKASLMEAVVRLLVDKKLLGTGDAATADPPPGSELLGDGVDGGELCDVEDKPSVPLPSYELGSLVSGAGVGLPTLAAAADQDHRPFPWLGLIQNPLGFRFSHHPQMLLMCA